MNLTDFHLIDNELIDNSIIKREYLKVYHQQGALLNDPDQNADFIIGENNNYHQAGSSHLGFDITLREADGNKFNFTYDPATNAVMVLVNNAFASCFKEATLTTTGAMEIEQVKFLEQVSTIMRALTSKDGDLLSHFDNIDGTENGNNNSSLEQMPNNNHTEANRGIIKGHLLLELIFGFCKTFKKNSKNLCFHLTLKTADLQDTIFTTIATDINGKN